MKGGGFRWCAGVRVGFLEDIGFGDLFEFVRLRGGAVWEGFSKGL